MLTGGYIDLSYDTERELLQYLYDLRLQRTQIDRQIGVVLSVVNDVRQGRVAQRKVALVKRDEATNG